MARSLEELKALCDVLRAGGEEPPVLTIDNDETFAYFGRDCVFRMDPETLLEQALDLLGIPHQEA